MAALRDDQNGLRVLCFKMVEVVGPVETGDKGPKLLKYLKFFRSRSEEKRGMEGPVACGRASLLLPAVDKSSTGAQRVRVLSTGAQGIPTDLSTPVDYLC